MKLSPECQKAYERWIGNDTWRSTGPQDKRRFYDFVNAFLRYSRSREMVGDDLTRDIISRYEAKLDSKVLREEAEHYTELFCEIVAFIRATKR